MRFTADRRPLLEAVARVQSSAGNGKSIPIVGMALLEAAGASVSIRTTDLTLEACASAGATVDQVGAICTPIDQLHELLRSVPDGADLTFATEAGDPRLAVTCGRSRFKLPMQPGSDFPRRDAGEAEVLGEVKAAALARLIDKTLFAASTDAARYHLHGVHLHVEAGPDGPLLRMVATNGALLAYAQTPCPAGLEALAPLTIPTRLATEMRRWLGALTSEVVLAASKGRVRLEVGEAQLQGQLIDSAFPDYRRVIPSEPQHRASFDAALIKAAVRRVCIAAEMTESKFKAVRLEVGMGGATMTTRSSLRGEAVEELEAECDAPLTQIGLNAGQFSEIAERVGGRLEVGFSDPSDPLVLRDLSDPAALFVLTTVRV